MKIPYYEVQEQLMDIISRDDRTKHAAVELEFSKDEIYEDRPGILIWLANAPREVITMGGAKPRQIKMEFLIECTAYGGIISESCKHRDSLLADVEEILQESNTRLTISDRVMPILFIEVTNTEFETARDNEGFLMAGILTVVITIRG